MNHGVFKEKDENSAFCTKIWSGGGQDAQNETCARLSRSNQNENLDKLARVRLACSKLVCLVGFLAFFGLFLNSQNNLFAETFTVTFDSEVSGVENMPGEQIVESGQKATDPGRVYTRGYYFLGWYNGENKFDFENTQITASITLKAKFASPIAYIEDDSSNLYYYLYDIEGELVAQVAGMVDRTATSIKIPDKVTYDGKDYKVIEIGNQTFAYCCQYDDDGNVIGGLKEVVFPASLYSIGDRAFDSCGNLSTVDFSSCENLYSIGYQAFAWCEKLSTVDLSSCKNLYSIGYQAFAYCSNLESITIPNSVTNIGNRVFYGCSSLKLVVVMNGEINFPQETFGYNMYYGWRNYPYHTVKFQDSATPAKTVMTQLVFQTFTRKEYDEDQGEYVDVEYEKPKTAADPKEYGIVAEWYQVINAETGETSGTAFTAWGTSISANLTLKCKSSEFFDVTFQDQAGKVVLTQKVEKGQKAIDPKEYGIVVMGEGNFWSADETNAFDFETTITTDYTLKATGIIGCVVTFDPAGESPVPESQTVAPGEKATKPADPTRAGYKFVGWFKGEEEFDFSTTITGPITLTAKWIETEKCVVHLKFSKVFTGNVNIAEAFLGDGTTNAYDGEKIQNFFEANFELYEGTNKLSIGVGENKNVLYDGEKYSEYISVDINEQNSTFTISIKLKIPNGCTVSWNSVTQDFDVTPKNYKIKELKSNSDVYKAVNPEVEFQPVQASS